MTLEKQKNALLNHLLYDNITVSIIGHTKIFETDVLKKLELSDPSYLYEFLKEIERDGYAECQKLTFFKEKYRKTAKGESFLERGGYKKENRYIKWIKDPDNIWKIIVGISATSYAIYLVISQQK